MSGEQARQVCHLIARLVDVMESIARQATSDELELTRLHNIRHDTLMLLARLS